MVVGCGCALPVLYLQCTYNNRMINNIWNLYRMYVLCLLTRSMCRKESSHIAYWRKNHAKTEHMTRVQTNTNTYIVWGILYIFTYYKIYKVYIIYPCSLLLWNLCKYWKAKFQVFVSDYQLRLHPHPLHQSSHIACITGKYRTNFTNYKLICLNSATATYIIQFM